MTHSEACTCHTGKGKRPVGGVRSLADVAKDTDTESDDDDEGNEYYAGGEKRYVACSVIAATQRP